MSGVLYISYDGMLEPLGQSQVLAYLERLAADRPIDLISFEKKADSSDMDCLQSCCNLNPSTTLLAAIDSAGNPSAGSSFRATNGAISRKGAIKRSSSTSACASCKPRSNR